MGFDYVNGPNMATILALFTFPFAAPAYLAAFALTLRNFLKVPLKKSCIRPWLAVSFTTALVLIHLTAAVSGMLTVGYLANIIPDHVQTVFEASQSYDYTYTP